MAPRLRNRRWLGWALLASLALNLLFAGFLVGTALRGGHGHGHHESDAGLIGFARALPEEHRHALRQAIRGSESEWRAGREAMRDAMAGIRAAIAREPFDAERLRRALAVRREAQGRLAERATDLLVERIGQMTPAERAALAERLGRGPERDGRH
ncbi:MAG TPA: periplasmic heavy metal sensor [Paracoccaceae bacterium]|nr:periplasmic heavy metal sensor [Paracoccaceae bacterium]